MRDWAGYWFYLLEQRGFPSQMRFGKLTDRGEVSWLEIPHWQTDGVGAMTALLRKDGYAIDFPQVPHSRRPSFLKKLRGFYHYLRFAPVCGGKWKRFDPSTSPKATRPLAFYVFSAKESYRIENHCQSRGFNTNSLLLWTLAHTLRDEFIENGKPHYWMIPVNMRGTVRAPSMSANQSSCLWVDTRSAQSPSQIYAQIRQRLAQGFPWGCWFAVNIGRLVGVRGVENVFDYLKSVDDHWMACFSNLGEWPSKEVWLAAPPVYDNSPLAALTIKSGGRIALILQSHPGLTQDKELLQNWLDSWLRRFELYLAKCLLGLGCLKLGSKNASLTTPKLAPCRLQQ